MLVESESKPVLIRVARSPFLRNLMKGSDDSGSAWIMLSNALHSQLGGGERSKRNQIGSTRTEHMNATSVNF